MSATTTYLLRVEGVNLAHVLDDTEHLSVRRGGGLMLLNAAAGLIDILPEEIRKQLQPVATGASIALFELNLTNNTAEQIRDAVESFLRTHESEFATSDTNSATLPSLRHATFVVDVVPIDEGDPQAAVRGVRLATARNRRRQLQQLSLSPHDLWAPAAKEPCALEKIRPATMLRDLPEQTQAPLSRSAAERLDYGRKARQDFYRAELQTHTQSEESFESFLRSVEFTNNLQDLSATISGHPHLAHLSGKLAVFYVDGNGFGQRGEEILTKSGIEGFKQWSQSLQKHHRQLLRNLHVQIKEEMGSWTNNGQIRLETLLWGGDEILWITPAWQGWRLAEWFFNETHQVNVGNTSYDLTYGCGLVFCHAKSPVFNIRKLARDLGDLAKRARPGEHALAYEVLESMDDVYGDLETYRKQFLPRGVDPKLLVLDPTELHSNREILHRVADSPEFPMRQLFRLCSRWRKGESTEAAEQRLLAECEVQQIPIVKMIDKLRGSGPPGIGWQHLLQMLPYVFSGNQP